MKYTCSDVKSMLIAVSDWVAHEAPVRSIVRLLIADGYHADSVADGQLECVCASVTEVEEHLRGLFFEFFDVPRELIPYVEARRWVHDLRLGGDISILSNDKCAIALWNR